jgi:hypothetical protein
LQAHAADPTQPAPEQSEQAFLQEGFVIGFNGSVFTDHEVRLTVLF